MWQQDQKTVVIFDTTLNNITFTQFWHFFHFFSCRILWHQQPNSASDDGDYWPIRSPNSNYWPYLRLWLPTHLPRWQSPGWPWLCPPGGIWPWLAARPSSRSSLVTSKLISTTYSIFFCFDTERSFTRVYFGKESFQLNVQNLQNLRHQIIK